MNFSMDPAETVRYDMRHIWHPYSSMKNPPVPRLVESAEGVRAEASPAERS